MKDRPTPVKIATQAASSDSNRFQACASWWKCSRLLLLFALCGVKEELGMRHQARSTTVLCLISGYPHSSPNCASAILNLLQDWSRFHLIWIRCDSLRF